MKNVVNNIAILVLLALSLCACGMKETEDIPDPIENIVETYVLVQHLCKDKREGCRI